ncbi:MAG: family 43 glycosylhydrolase [Roseburia sp.]|nr:family 43 glycosylhydrolase [Roseburia sp.]
MKEFKNTRNPILPFDIHVPDGEAHVMPDGKLYIYGSFDDRKDTYCSEKYHVVSTADMEHWTIHDVSFNGKDVPWFYDPNAPKYQGIDWNNLTPFMRKLQEQPQTVPVILEEETEEEEIKSLEEKKNEAPAFLYAPDAIYKDGKYYLYFCMSDNSEGVAVSDRAEGPFTNPIQLPCGGIDPAVFADTDGQVYYYWGQLYARGVKLNPDMISFDEQEIVHNLVTEEEHFFHEGASMRKIGDTYYLVYSDMERGKPTALGYATAESPLGPFTYRGIIIDNAGCDPASWNNHGSIEQINGQWYIFYHRSSRCTRQYRRLCIEPITLNPDGAINEVKMTSQGVGKPFGPGETIYGYQACQLSGTAFIDADKKGGEWITNISKEDAAVFRYVESETGFRSIVVEAEGSGFADIYLNDRLAGSVGIDVEGANQGILSDSEKGPRELKLVFRETEKLRIISVTLYENKDM